MHRAATHGQRAVAVDGCSARRWQQRVAAVVTAGLALLTLGCEDPPQEEAKPAAFSPQPPVLPRLLRSQYHNSIGDVLGADLTMPTSLEPDIAFDDLFAVGAGVAKVSPRGVELYEDAARSLAAQVAGKPERLTKLLPCQPKDALDAECLGQLVDKVAPLLWRRPMATGERKQVLDQGLAAAKALGTFAQGAEYVLARLLQSPHFLYRVEHGEADPAHASTLRVTQWELAARLALFLWNGPADQALLAAAAQGKLHDPAEKKAQVLRMLADPKAKRAVRNFAQDWLKLAGLQDLSKDPKIYKHYSADLGASAAEETLRNVEALVFDRNADLGELLTSRSTFVDRRLAAIYDVPAVEEKGFHAVQWPQKGERAGLLGQVSFLALAAHATTSSATLRGVYMRKVLLCDQVPDPPAGLNTALPEPNSQAKTLRERSAVHLEVKYCATCHQDLDSIGLGLERFDGVGRYRLTDHGAPIDSTGHLDKQPFEDAAQLGQRIAASPKFTRCVVQKLYGYALGRPVAAAEKAVVDDLTSQFVKDGRRLKLLMQAVALSDGFVRLKGGQP